MPITDKEVIDYMRLEIASRMIGVETPSDLESTLDSQVSAKENEISAYRKSYSANPVGGRAKYVQDVGALKTQLQSLIDQNNAIKERNRVKNEAAKADFDEQDILIRQTKQLAEKKINKSELDDLVLEVLGI